MKAEYNKWYKCQEGQMPEDFENVLGRTNGNELPNDTIQVLTIKENGYLHVDSRVYGIYNVDEELEELEDWQWQYAAIDTEVIAWMLPEPYEEATAND